VGLKSYPENHTYRNRYPLTSGHVRVTMGVQFNNVMGRRENVHPPLSQTVVRQRNDLLKDYTNPLPRRFLVGVFYFPEKESKGMFKKMGSVAVLMLSGLLLVYSASRSLSFISLTLPADRQILAWFGLAALDIGLVVWLIAFLYGSHGWQRPLAATMVVVDLIGAIGIFTADTWYEAGRNGLIRSMTSDQVQTMVIILCGIIACNIAGAVMHIIVDPEQLKNIAEEDAHDKIEDATLRKISENAEALAAELAPKIAADWTNRTRAKYSSKMAARSPGGIAVSGDSRSPLPYTPMISLNSETELAALDPNARKNGGQKK
jgi:hypothetical protein